MPAQLDILQQIVNVLRVQDLASQYSSSLDKFLYTIFFPVILIIMIIYILSARMFPNHKGISILLGISFIIFIIVYPPESEFSLYSAFAPIGTLWYLVVIVIGVFWILLGRILPSERGAGGPMAREGHMPGVARGGKGIFKRFEDTTERLSGEHARRLEARLRVQLNGLENKIATRARSRRNPRGLAAIDSNFEELREKIQTLIADIEAMPVDERKRINTRHYEDRLNDITDRFYAAA